MFSVFRVFRVFRCLGFLGCRVFRPFRESLQYVRALGLRFRPFCRFRVYLKKPKPTVVVGYP